ncbi:MAG TPA: alpha/beta hydrolase [Acidimicrobiia bacterium]
MTAITKTVVLDDIGPVEISLDEVGAGKSFLLLHGGGGPDTMTPFGQRFAESHPAGVLVPTHPGFASTPRPEKLDTIRRLAALYVALLEDLDLSDVTIVGNSIGGWITVEMALLEPPRVSGVVLLDAVGIDVPGQPVADFFSMGYDEFLERAFSNPDPFRIDPTNLSPAAQTAAAANRSALATYTGGKMNDPTLAKRLGGLEIPTLVLWGDRHRIASPEYGRAYANSIPRARYQVLSDVGHLPQVEKPDLVIHAVWNTADNEPAPPDGD